MRGWTKNINHISLHLTLYCLQDEKLYNVLCSTSEQVKGIHSTTEQVKTDEKISKYCIIVKSSVQQYAYQPSVEPWVSLERDLQAEAIAIKICPLVLVFPSFSDCKLFNHDSPTVFNPGFIPNLAFLEENKTQNML